MSMLEILISFLLLSIVALGAGLESLNSLRESEASYYLSAALQQLTNLDDYLQGVRGHADTASFFHEWQLHTAQMLPQGLGSMEGSYPAYQISVFWGGENQDTCKQNSVGKRGCWSFQR